MKILKKGRVKPEKEAAKNYYMRCPSCNSKLKFDISDVKVERTGLRNVYVSGIPMQYQHNPGKECTEITYVECPLCFNHIKLDEVPNSFAGDAVIPPPTPSLRYMYLYSGKDALKKYVSPEEEEYRIWYDQQDD